MSSSFVHHEKYHDEYSMNIAAACVLSQSMLTVAYYDISLGRIIARSVSSETVDAENAAAQFAKLVFTSMREYSISASALHKIGFAAPIHISAVLEDQLDPTDMFLRPDTELVALPFVSAYADAGFAAFLATVPIEKGTLCVSFGKTLNLAFRDGEKLRLAHIQLTGAFDGSAFESGMPAEFGAIDQVSRDKEVLCYSVVGDGDSCGIAPSAALDAVTLMLAEGILDQDGIMTDRDLFYIGEDYFVSQSDVRAVQSDKAAATAAISAFMQICGAPAEIYLNGEVLAAEGMKRLHELGVINNEFAARAHFNRCCAEQGVINCLEAPYKIDELEELISAAEDVTEDIMKAFDDMYITNLSF